MWEKLKTLKKEPTAKLLNSLNKTRNINNFMDKYKAQLSLPTLAEHLANLCEQKNIEPKTAIKNAGIDRVYGAHIFSGERTNPSRDYLIKFALGLELDYDECQELLEVARESKLYLRVQRDAVIISCLRDKLTPLQADDRLDEFNMPSLGEKNERK